jgi:xylulokinase
LSLIGIDIGSSSCKGVVFDHMGGILKISQAGYATHMPFVGMVEMDPSDIWTAFCKVVSALSDINSDNKIEAMGISSHGESFVPVDYYGNAVGSIIMNSDNRAQVQTDMCGEKIGAEKIYDITGLPLHSMYSLPKILWIRDNDKELFMRTSRFVSLKDYVLGRLGLEGFTDHTLASRTMAFDIRSRKWSKEILDVLGLKADIFNESVSSDQKIGKLSVEAAAMLGLPKEITIVAGGHDQPCGALGVGTIAQGDACISSGTYECISLVSNISNNNDLAYRYNLNSYCHVVENKYITLAFFPSGIMSSWFADEFFIKEKEEALISKRRFYDVIDEKTAEICTIPTNICVTPHLIGACNPYWDVKATGTIAGLRSGATRYHIYKAVYEGIACELAQNIEALESLGEKLNDISVYGGNASSEYFLQLRADITGKRLNRIGCNEAVCKGAAMLAGIAAGVYRDAEEAVLCTAIEKREIKPDPKMSEIYKKQVEKYKILYDSLKRFREE